MVKQKAEQSPAETSSETVIDTSRPTGLGKYVWRIILLAAICGAGYALWKNPQLADRARSWLKPAEQEDPYAARFSDLQNQIAGLQNQLNQTNYKLDNSGFAEVKEQIRNLEKMNLNMIDSKADVAAVLGVITRMDAAEQKIGNLSEITDNSALILTGTLLVKDAADRGQTFEYEAEVLNQIAADSPQAAAHVQKISAFAAEGIPSNLALSLQFERIYAQIRQRHNIDSDQAQTWKDRINSKLNEIVQIKKTDEATPEFESGRILEEAAALVKNDDLLRAADLLKKSTDPEISASAGLQEWIAKVEQREDFYRAVSALSADSLAALKVNNLKKIRGK